MGFLGMVMALGLVACGMPGVAHATGGLSPDHREATRLMGELAATVELPSTISVRARHIQFSRDGSKAFAVGGGRFSVIDVGSDTVSGSIEVPGAGADVVISPDESTAFLITDFDTSTVTFVDIATLRVSGTVPLAAEGGRLAVTPDGSTLYAAVDATSPEPPAPGSVTVIDVASRRVDTVVAVGSGPGQPLVAGGSVCDVARLRDVARRTHHRCPHPWRPRRVGNEGADGGEPRKALAVGSGSISAALDLPPCGTASSCR